MRRAMAPVRCATRCLTTRTPLTGSADARRVLMPDPTPPRPGYGALADRITKVERDVARLGTPSGTQRMLTSDTTQATVDYLASLKSYGSTGVGSASLTNQPTDGVIRWFQVSAGPPNNHAIGPIDVPTGRLLVQASVGEASMSPVAGEFMIAYISFRVNNSDGDIVVAVNTFSGRAYFNQRIGLGITTGPIGITVDPLDGPFTITPLIGIWGQVGSGGTNSCTYNNPSLRVEIIGSGVQ